MSQGVWPSPIAQWLRSLQIVKRGSQFYPGLVCFPLTLIRWPKRHSWRISWWHLLQLSTFHLGAQCLITSAWLAWLKTPSSMQGIGRRNNTAKGCALAKYSALMRETRPWERDLKCCPLSKYKSVGIAHRLSSESLETNTPGHGCDQSSKNRTCQSLLVCQAIISSVVEHF